ncbi:hypothetical protein FA95DRAFT_1581610 [Auriscalpium vulgare]|uniref:Uncharacterized protein n=1 Tax=Auriscalpium vulgare TaxID=40419 RepID=A0ACB8S042_9AGAM|nr:hypothetical protein FA95DRAFT_1581610 [Auriscalpium vulgare]
MVTVSKENESQIPRSAPRCIQVFLCGPDCDHGAGLQGSDLPAQAPQRCLVFPCSLLVDLTFSNLRRIGSEREREHETKGVFAVEVEAIQALLGDEPQGGVQRERGGVVELGLEEDLRGQLIASLTPPSVPSLTTARSLLGSLASATSTVSLSTLNPVLSALCKVDNPPTLRAVGFDILSAFLDKPHARYRALVALTQDGTEIVGIEVLLLRMLESWIGGAFAGILTRDNVSAMDRAEREKSIESLCAFLNRTMSKPETLARLGENDVGDVLQFFGGLVERALYLPTELYASPASPSEQQSPVQTPTRAAYTHRRHPSSASIPLASSSATPAGNVRKPIEVAVTAYLDHLNSHLRYLSHVHLNNILPVLFRSLAAFASSLPRLSISGDSFDAPSPLESKIVETLDQLINGAYNTTCFIILKHLLMPQTNVDMRTAIQTSIGACRSLRIYIRRALCSRLARAYISRMSTDNYTPSGAPGGVDLDKGLFERAWPKEEVTKGDLGRVGHVLFRAAEAWVSVTPETFEGASTDLLRREDVLLEIGGVLKDVFQEYDARGDNGDIDEEEKNVVGEILLGLTSYVRALRGQDGEPLLIPLSSPTDAPTPFLSLLSSLLARDHKLTPCNPLLTTIQLSISDHLADANTAVIVETMHSRGDLSPITLDWLDNWMVMLSTADIGSPSRPLTRIALLDALQKIYELVKDVPVHRHSLVNLGLQSGGRDGYETVWNILADELVLRMIEVDEQGRERKEADKFVNDVLDFLTTTAREADDADAFPAEFPPVTQSPTSMTSTHTSPVISRGQSEFVIAHKDKESSLPLSSLFSLSQLTSGTSTRSQSQTPLRRDDESAQSAIPVTQEPPVMLAAVGAVVALVHIFSQLSFTPYALSEPNRALAVRVFSILVELLRKAKSSRARLAVLQFFFRLRVDRDHRLFSVYERYDRLGHIATLAGLIGRVPSASEAPSAPEESPSEILDASKVRARAPERDGRRASRGRDKVPSRSTSSRSRSRVATRVASATMPASDWKPRKPIWHVPEVLPFSIPESDTPSDGLISYDPDGPGRRIVLPISSLLLAMIELIQNERDWEILSYILCHLPTLLSNKHFFCGPKSRAAIAKLLTTLCNGIFQSDLALSISQWPAGLRPRDAQGLAFHTLSVLISYRKCFEPSQRHVLVEVLMSGLSGQQSTIKACLQALSLAAFELPDSMKRFLPDILNKLVQIMTNASMAVHIIDFLAIVGSLPSLYANFTEPNFKMVFGVALQYLRLHNKPELNSDTSWALSQHLRIMSYYIVYLWFLALKLPDRPKHVKYITRQLLLANEGQDEIDESAEVCFDWLARYTYASADPRPTSSMLSDILMNSAPQTASDVIAEKTWIVGTAVLTVRALTKIGWVEVVARRASGLTRFLARIENVPMVGPGEVDPDMVSVPAILAMERDSSSEDAKLYQVRSSSRSHSSAYPSKPDAITGYVWQGSAPSQRRKDVAIDPAFFALQLSAYPDYNPGRRRAKVVDVSSLPSLFRTLDRMPVIDTHKVGIMYVAPGQTHEKDILANKHGSPAYSRFLEGLGRLINLRGQVDVYAGGLHPDEDGEYAYAWWDDIGQILYHTATLMPNHDDDPQFVQKKRHIGNDFVRIVWNDSGKPYEFGTLATQFQFVNIVIEPHSIGAIAAFSNNLHENEYFRVIVQRAPGMTEFSPIGNFKLISAENLPLLVRQVSLLADWFASVFQHTKNDTVRCEMETNWQARLQAIKRFQAQLPPSEEEPEAAEGILRHESQRDFTTTF